MGERDESGQRTAGRRRWRRWAVRAAATGMVALSIGLVALAVTIVRDRKSVV